MPTVAANGLTIHYEARGPVGAPVMVFVNALGATVEMWRAQVEAFAGRYRCLAYDANGHGRSSAKAAPARIEELAADLGALLDALGIPRATIVGASIGGMTAQMFAATHPDRVVRLALISTSAKMPDPAPWLARAAEARRDGLDAIAKAVMTPRWFTPRFAAEQPARVEETRKLFAAVNRESYARGAEAVGVMDLRDLHGSIAARTLVLAAAGDPATPPAMGQDIAARIPGAVFLLLPDAAHLVMIERAVEVNAYLAAFLGLPSAEARVRARPRPARRHHEGAHPWLCRRIHATC